MELLLLVDALDSACYGWLFGLPEFITSDVGSALSAFVADVMLFFLLGELTSSPIS